MAQARHTLAHNWQCCASCFAHSLAQASQSSAHIAQTLLEFALLRDMTEAAKEQACAQSISSAMQRAIILTSDSCKHEAAQSLQATKQALHASIQALNFRCGMDISLSVMRGQVGNPFAALLGVGDNTIRSVSRAA